MFSKYHKAWMGSSTVVDPEITHTTARLVGSTPARRDVLMESFVVNVITLTRK